MSGRRGAGARPRVFGLRLEALETRCVLTAWHNADVPQDVDNSGEVVSLDALQVINEMTRLMSGTGAYAINDDGLLPTSRPSDAPFLDVNDDGYVSPIDALRVINLINNESIDPDPNDNVFYIHENAAGGSEIGQVNPSTTVTSDSRFEFFNDAALTQAERDAFELRPGDHYIGAADAEVLIIEYVDFQCPVCGIFHPLNEQALEDFDGSVAYVTRHFPLSNVHANAVSAAVAAEAAGNQGKFYEMADKLFENQQQWGNAQFPASLYALYASEIGLDVSQFEDDFDNEDTLDRVLNDRSEAANDLGVSGTPTYFFNQQRASPGPAQSQLNSVIQAAIDLVDTPFKMDRFTGEIRLRDGFALDFESQSSYSFDVMVNGQLEAIEVRVVDVGGV